MKLKRGVISLQFNWIFVLVAGTIILVLITGIMIKQSNLSKVSLNILILNNLDNIFSSLESNEGLVYEVKIPESKLEFACNSYSIEGISKQLDGVVIFSPSILEGKIIISTTIDWKIPFKATNFVYLSNPDRRYIFVSGDEFARSIYDLIPNEIEKDIYSNQNQIVGKNDVNVRIIFFEDYIENINIPFAFNSGRESITALKVSGDKDKGSIDFFDVQDNIFVLKGTSYYARNEGLLGAVFSDDVSKYECVMVNAFKKLELVSQVYESKAKNLMITFVDHECEQYYDSAAISVIKESSRVFSFSMIDSIDINAKNLELQNNQLKNLSCPLIY